MPREAPHSIAMISEIRWNVPKSKLLGSMEDNYVLVQLRFGWQTGFCDDRLKQLDGIPGRVFQDDLLATQAGHDLIAEASTTFSQPFYHRNQIIHLDGKAVPAARFLLPAIRHGLTASTCRVGHAEHQAQVAAREHGESWRRVHIQMKTKLLSVKLDS